MQTQEHRPLPFSSLEQKCSTCGRLIVCTIHRAVGPLLANWEEDAPMDVDDLAKICEAYLMLAGEGQL